MYQNTGGAIGALDTALTTGQRTAAGREFGLLLGGNAVQFRPDVDNQFTQTDFRIISFPGQTTGRPEYLHAGLPPASRH